MSYRAQVLYEAEVERSISFIGQRLDFFTRAKVTEILDVAASHFGEVSQLTLQPFFSIRRLVRGLRASPRHAALAADIRR